MKEWKTLTRQETKEVVDRANVWLSKHSAFVKCLASMDDYAYAPSGSDLWHPELWKSGHWNWFLDMAKHNDPMLDVQCISRLGRLGWIREPEYTQVSTSPIYHRGFISATQRWKHLFWRIYWLEWRFLNV